jgi:hypothetical protein
LGGEADINRAQLMFGAVFTILGLISKSVCKKQLGFYAQLLGEASLGSDAIGFPASRMTAAGI